MRTPRNVARNICCYRTLLHEPLARVFLDDISDTEVFDFTLVGTPSPQNAYENDGNIVVRNNTRRRLRMLQMITQHFICAVSSSIMRIMIICNNAGVVRNRIKSVCWANPPNLTIADPHECPRRSLSIKATKKLASTLHEPNWPRDPADTPEHHTQARFVSPEPR